MTSFYIFWIGDQITEVELGYTRQVCIAILQMILTVNCIVILRMTLSAKNQSTVHAELSVRY